MLHSYSVTRFLIEVTDSSPNSRAVSLLGPAVSCECDGILRSRLVSVTDSDYPSNAENKLSSVAALSSFQSTKVLPRWDRVWGRSKGAGVKLTICEVRDSYYLKGFSIFLSRVDSSWSGYQCGARRDSNSEQKQMFKTSFLVEWQSEETKGMRANEPNQ